MGESQDQDILEGFETESGRNMAFSLLVNRYQERLYWHIRRMVIDHDDSDDVLQNTFIKAFNGLKKFRGDSQLFTWLYRIATNESLTFLKKKRTKFFVPMVDVEYELSQNLEADALMSGDEIQLKLQKAVLKLPEKQRLVFNMKYFEEMKYEAMSEILGTSVGALKASYHHAVKKIEKFVLED
ncbi:MAG: RNA polymerase sigma factor (sigma-70 family) [Granulosicoccus sp.]|jgi:RNA polymerase sigma factor (sigma-70 family)